MKSIKITQLQPGMMIRDQINRLKRVIAVDHVEPNFRVQLEPDVDPNTNRPIERVEIFGPKQVLRTE